MSAATLSLPSMLELKIPLTDDQFFQLCQDNPNLRFERTASGELLIMSLTGGETGNRNIELAFQLQAWSRQNNLGIAFDSSTCFKLPNGANRSPDAAWVQREKWTALTPEQRQKFPPLCPDFVVELRSASDSLETLRAKMREYLDNGLRLGWLIDPKTEQVEIYRLGQTVERLQSPTTLLGEAVLPPFVLDVAPVMRIEPI